MPQEIERKFLTQGEQWRSLAPPVLYRQGYISTKADREVWIQTKSDGVSDGVSNELCDGVQLVVKTARQTIDFPVPPEFQSELIALSHQPRSRPTQRQLRSQDDLTLRPRIAGTTGLFTIKTRSQGIARSEYEFEIPLSTAHALLDQVCDRPLIEKYRTKITYEGLIWEVDDFLGENQGLILAEVELESADQLVCLPEWIGREVSGDRRYFNSYLVRHPFQTWS